jgi:N6-adenosine-specific RNA methylase IME4
MPARLPMPWVNRVDIIIPPQAGQYGVIYADPPWAYETYSAKGKGRSAEAHYDCLSLEDIKALPVTAWAAKDAVLYVWCTAPHLENALAVLAAWGFAYKSNFAWIKERIGTGYWSRNRHEHLLLGTRGSDRHEHLLIGARGSMVCPRYRGIPPADSVIEGQRREHSRKPDRAAEIIEQYYPDVPKLEMFARFSRPGWDVWGDQVGLLDHGPAPARRWASDSWPGGAR